MIDPLLSLAFTIHANPGVYACLLGSGISRAAEIPTGWEIVLDLVRKLAHLLDEDCDPDPASWYVQRFSSEPDYAQLLDQLAHSPAERSNLLRSYFEPTEEERERGAKLPTQAHKAVAELVDGGTIRVIVTTNFDRLMEQALEEKGIAPTVIATSDAAEGAMPLAHSRCTLIKVHGDYLDTRIKNTPRELEAYDERIDRLLDQILDEYGLIICGWSGEWDTALIAALERSQSRRFTTYWAAHQGRLSDNGKRLVALRKAEVIPIEGADRFFARLSEKVSALQQYDRPHPLSVETAVASLKRYVAEDRYRIALHDLIVEETNRVCDLIDDQHFPISAEYSDEELINRIHRYEAVNEVLQALVAYGCFWGREQHRYLWVQTLQRVSNVGVRGSGQIVWLNLKLYPALYLLYSGGIAAVAARYYGTLKALLFEPSIRDVSDEDRPIIALLPGEVMEGTVQKRLPGKKQHYVPLSDYLFETLREPLRDVVVDDNEYERCFDLFEYLFCLLYIDARYKEIPEDGQRVWGPVGRFIWKHFGWRSVKTNSVAVKLDEEVAELGEKWGLLEAGAFNGALERFEQVKKAADDFIKKSSPRG